MISNSTIVKLLFVCPCMVCADLGPMLFGSSIALTVPHADELSPPPGFAFGVGGAGQRLRSREAGWTICVSVDRLDEHFRDAATDCQPGPARLRWARRRERDGLRHLPRIASGQPGDGKLRGEIGLFGDLEIAGRFRRLPEFRRNVFHRWNPRAIHPDRPGRRPARDDAEDIRHVLGGGSAQEIQLYGLRQHRTDESRRSSACGVRQGDAGYSRERQLSGGERLLGTVRMDTAGRRRAGRRTLVDGHAWISGRRRQGNPGFPDRPWRHGGRAIHFQREVKMQDWLLEVHFLLTKENLNAVYYCRKGKLRQHRSLL